MKTQNLKNATELTEKQLRQVIGGDRKPPRIVDPGDGTGNSERFDGYPHVSVKR